jgi:hypothetical protein
MVKFKVKGRGNAFVVGNAKPCSKECTGKHKELGPILQIINTTDNHSSLQFQCREEPILTITSDMHTSQESTGSYSPGSARKSEK